LNQIGDLLFALPALHALRQRFPDADIASIVRPNCSELLLRTGLVNEVISRPRGSTWSDLRMSAELRRRGFDLLVLFSTSPATWLVAQAAGARIKAGFKDSMGGFMLDISSPWSPPPSTRNNLRLVELIGCSIVKADYVGLICPTADDKATADSVLSERGIESGVEFAVIAPGVSGGRETKAWSEERYAEVADRVALELGLRAVIVGTGRRSSICDLSKHAVDLTGKTSLPVLASVLERAELFIGTDSGVMHLAAAMRTPVVALFGPTNPEITGPQGEGHVIVSKGVGCSPCYGHSCDDAVCMKTIEVVDVVDAAIAVARRV
jgi:ADP-heptose:LPS heptosyltransferase